GDRESGFGKEKAPAPGFVPGAGACKKSGFGDRDSGFGKDKAPAPGTKPGAGACFSSPNPDPRLFAGRVGVELPANPFGVTDFPVVGAAVAGDLLHELAQELPAQLRLGVVEERVGRVPQFANAGGVGVIPEG